MDGRKELATSLVSVRDEMSRAVAELASALAEERAALDAADADALDAAGAAKARHLAVLEQLDVERRHLMAHLGVDESALSDDQDWCALRDGLTACHQVNQVNGAIVARRLAHVREALAALSGQPPAPMTYGPGGQRLPPSLVAYRQHV